MRIGVFGAGATAGFFGGLLARAGHDVRFIARGAHLGALVRDGLRVQSTAAGDFEVRVPAAANPAEVGQCDLVLFSVKAADLEQGVAAIAPMVGPGTLIIPLLNGLDAPYRLRDRYGSAVLGGTCAIESYIAEPGLIVNPSSFATLTFGELEGGITPRAEAVREAMARARIQVTLTADVVQALWVKLMMLATFSGFTTLLQQPIGPIREQPETLGLIDRMVREIYTVGEAEGASLTEDHVARVLQTIRGVAPTMKSSMQRDREKGRPLEVELVHGAVVRRARARGIAVPVTETIYGLLQVLAGGG